MAGNTLTRRGLLKKKGGTVAAELAWSDLFNVIRDVTGVRKIEPTGLLLNSTVGNVNLLHWEFPILGTVTLTNGDTGAALSYTP